MNQQLPFPTGDVGTVRMKPRRASNVLLWAILLFLVVFVVWAHFTELDRTVRGQGRVVPSAQLQTVSNLEGGVVEEILVRTGDDIARGSPIIRLSPVASTAELGATQSQYAALGTKIERLGAEVGGRAPSLGGSAAQVSAERQLYQARTAELASLSAAGQARVVAAERAVAEARAAYDARQSALSAARTELSSIAPLVRAGIEPQLSLTKAESAVAIAGSEAAAAAAAVTRASAQVAEARAASSQARQDWRARSADELAAAQSERAARGQGLPALADRLRRTVLRAPLAGRINRVLVTTVGGAVSPGQPLVEIVPSDDKLLIEARVTPQDIANVRTDQDAKIDITAYDPAVYGSLRGKVVTIAPDAVVDEKTGESFYLVQVRTEDQLKDPRTGRPLAIGPGMIASVALLGDKRSVLSYILSPLTKLSGRAFRE